MKKNFIPTLTVILTVVLFASLEGCKADKLPLPAVPTLCDSIAATYNDTVKAIIDAKCAVSGCHSGTQSPSLTNYTEVHGDAARAMTRALDLQTMPPSGMPQLSNEEIDILNCWRNAGYPEN